MVFPSIITTRHVYDKNFVGLNLSAYILVTYTYWYPSFTAYFQTGKGQQGTKIIFQHIKSTYFQVKWIDPV